MLIFGGSWHLVGAKIFVTLTIMPCTLGDALVQPFCFDFVQLDHSVPAGWCNFMFACIILRYIWEIIMIMDTK